MTNETRSSKAVAKSLHTVTVIMQVAALFERNGNTRTAALDEAMATLGLAGRPDPYGLKAKAAELMGKAK